MGLEEKIGEIDDETVEETKKSLRKELYGCLSLCLIAGASVIGTLTYIGNNIYERFNSKPLKLERFTEPENKKNKKIANNIEKTVIEHIEKIQKSTLNEFLEKFHGKEYAKNNFDMYNLYYTKHNEIESLDKLGKDFIIKNNDLLNKIIKKYEEPKLAISYLPEIVNNNKELVEYLVDNCNQYSFFMVPKKLLKNHSDLLLKIAQKSKEEAGYVLGSLKQDNLIMHKQFYMDLLDVAPNKWTISAMQSVPDKYVEKYRDFLFQFSTIDKFSKLDSFSEKDEYKDITKVIFVDKSSSEIYKNIPFHLVDKHRDFLIEFAKKNEADTISGAFSQFTDKMITGNEDFLFQLAKEHENTVGNLLKIFKEGVPVKEIGKAITNKLKLFSSIYYSTLNKNMSNFENEILEYIEKIPDLVKNKGKETPKQFFEWLMGYTLPFLNFMSNYNECDNFIKNNKKYATDIFKEKGLGPWKLQMISQDYNNKNYNNGKYVNEKYVKKSKERLEFLIKENKKHFGITNFFRYDMNILEESLKNRDKEYNKEKPIALMLFRNLDLIDISINATKKIINKLGNYKVMIYEGQDDSMIDKIKKVYDEQGRKISELIFVTDENINEFQYDLTKDEKYILNEKDLDKISKNSKYLMKNANVWILGEATGYKGKKGKNVANLLAKAFRGHKVYSPKESFEYDKFKLIMEKGYIKDVDFGVPKYIALEKIK